MRLLPDSIVLTAGQHRRVSAAWRGATPAGRTPHSEADALTNKKKSTPCPAPPPHPHEAASPPPQAANTPAGSPAIAPPQTSETLGRKMPRNARENADLTGQAGQMTTSTAEINSG